MRARRNSSRFNVNFLCRINLFHFSLSFLSSFFLSLTITTFSISTHNLILYLFIFVLHIIPRSLSLSLSLFLPHARTHTPTSLSRSLFIYWFQAWIASLYLSSLHCFNSISLSVQLTLCQSLYLCSFSHFVNEIVGSAFSLALTFDKTQLDPPSKSKFNKTFFLKTNL